MAMGVKDVIAQLLERGMAMQTFWGFYITVSLGLIVFFGNAKRSSRLPYLAGLVSLAFVAFAWVNCSGMIAISAQRNFLYGLLGSVIGVVGNPSPTAFEIEVARGFIALAEPDAPEKVKWFHIGCDVAVLVAIWFLTLWPVKEATDASESADRHSKKKPA